MSRSSVKRRFTAEEDQIICTKVSEVGTNSWPEIAAFVPHRDARQCRERWKHYLQPGIDSGPWTTEEDLILIDRFRTFGTKWAAFQEWLPGRTDVQIKNRWALISRNKHLGYLKGRERKQEREQIVAKREIKESGPRWEWPSEVFDDKSDGDDFGA
jgi:hypothetical protein